MNLLREDGMAVVPDDGAGWSRSPFPLAYRCEGLDDILNPERLPAKEWLVKGVIARGETSAWIAPPGGMKSALLTELAIAVSQQGVEKEGSWHGYKVPQCSGVVYFALERADLVRRRLRAHFARLCDIEEPSGISVVPTIVDLMDPESITRVVQTVKRAEKLDLHQPVGLIIFDTFAKLIASGGGDEDKAKDQGKVFAHIQRIKDAFDRGPDKLGPPHIALIGHTGKDESRGSRGSNAILGDADIVVQISGDGIKTATVTKANDAPEGPLFSFKGEVHNFGVDEDGDPVTVNIVVEADTEPSQKKSKWAPGLRLVRDCIAAAALESPVEHRIGGDGPNVIATPVGAARVLHNQRYVSSGEGDRTEAERKAWQRNFKAARSAGLIAGELANGQELIWMVT